MTYQPGLPVADPAAAERIEAGSLEWFHAIDVGGYITPTRPPFGDVAYRRNWEFVAEFLQRHRDAIEGAGVLEPGCADGLWTCWLTRLGARHIDATDADDRVQFRLIAQAFGLPVVYHPRILSTHLPAAVRERYDLVCSLGLLYHVHDPFSTLVMYRRYLKTGGALILETAGIDAAEPYLHYTGAGEIYNKSGNNHFLPTRGFLHSILAELDMTIEDEASRFGGSQDRLGRVVGRTILIARAAGSLEVHRYRAILDRLGMWGQPFEDQEIAA